MTSRQFHAYQSAKATAAALRRYRDVYAHNEGMVAEVSRVEAMLERVTHLAQEQLSVTKGGAATGLRARQELIVRLWEVCGIGEGWAAAVGREELRARLTVTEAGLSALGLRILLLAPVLLSAAQEAASLGAARYGLTGEVLADLAGHIERLGVARSSRDAIDERKAVTAELDRALKELMAFLRDVLDPLMQGYRRRAPRFLEAYRLARRIGGRSPVRGNLQGAGPVRAFLDDDLGADAFLEQSDVGNDADEFVLLPQAFQSGQRDFQGIGIERAETFIDKQRVDPDVATRETGQTERHGEAGEEAFPAGETGGGAAHPGLEIVLDLQAELGVRGAAELVAVGEPDEVAVGVPDEQVQRNSLCKGAEFLSGGIADQLTEAAPVPELIPFRGQLGGALRVQRTMFRVLGETLASGSEPAPDGGNGFVGFLGGGGEGFQGSHRGTTGRFQSGQGLHAILPTDFEFLARIRKPRFQGGDTVRLSRGEHGALQIVDGAEAAALQIGLENGGERFPRGPGAFPGGTQGLDVAAPGLKLAVGGGAGGEFGEQPGNRASGKLNLMRDEQFPEAAPFGFDTGLAAQPLGGVAELIETRDLFPGFRGGGGGTLAGGLDRFADRVGQAELCRSDGEAALDPG